MYGINLPSALGVGIAANSGESAGLSSAIWEKFSSQSLSQDGRSAFFIGDDFLNFGKLFAVASNVGYYGGPGGPYSTFEDTSTTLLQSLTSQGGVITASLDATDNHEVALTQGSAYSTTVAGKCVLGALFYDTVASRRRVAFEARVKVSSVVDDVNAWFVGLTEENTAANSAKIDDTGVMADKDFIGFQTVHTNGGTTGTNALLKFSYKKAGQTVQNAAAGTVAAATWMKVGWVYDPNSRPSRMLMPYLNGVPLSSIAVTATAIDAATFPDGEELCFSANTKSGVATASTFEVDWWMAGYER